MMVRDIRMLIIISFLLLTFVAIGALVAGQVGVGLGVLMLLGLAILVGSELR